MPRFSGLLSAVALLTGLGLPLAASAAGMAMPAVAPKSGDMKMAMPMSDAPAHFKPTRAAYTTDHRFLIKLLSLPSPIPYQQYFTIRLAVYQGHPPHKRLAGVPLDLFAGMRHGLKHGFAHGMNSSPRLGRNNGVITVSGMYFHMMGPWVLKTTVYGGGKPSVAYFKLPCCGK